MSDRHPHAFDTRSIVWSLLSAAAIFACGGGGDGGPATPPAVAAVEVSPATASVVEGATTQLAATVRDTRGNQLSGRAVSWASSSAATATVSSDGLVSGVAAGAATITATSEGKNGVAQLTVTARPVASVSLTPATATIAVGGTATFVATLRDAAGTALTGRAITWSTSAATIASVSSAGVVTGVATGSATITATSEGRAGTASVTVQTPAFAPTTNVTLSGTQRFSTVTVAPNVTVTFNAPLTIEASGAINIQGRLRGDCHALRIIGRDSAVVRGTIDNSCSDTTATTRPKLTFVAVGGFLFDSATVRTSGDGLIANDTTASGTAPRVSPSVVSARSRAAAATIPCQTRAGTLLIHRPLVARRGQSGTTQGGPGSAGGDWTMRCRGNSQIIGTIVAAQTGGDGGDATHTVPNGSLSVIAGPGGPAGIIDIDVQGDLTIDGSTLVSGSGGFGGRAIAAILNGQGKATATGGDGGDARGVGPTGESIYVKASGKVALLGVVAMNAGVGLGGGDAIAKAPHGEDAVGQTAAKPGGMGEAIGGNGGFTGDVRILALGGTTGAFSVTSTPPFIDGGFADAESGNGGNGGPDAPDGAIGGTLIARGGKGGISLLTDGTSSLLIPGGNGGRARVRVGALGGIGFSDCGVADTRRGGQGGTGGSGQAIGGPPGTPLSAGGVNANPGPAHLIDFANAGKSGDGDPPGAAGLRGADLGSTPAPTVQNSLQPGVEGRPCAYGVTIGSQSDPHGHFPFVLFHLLSDWIIHSPIRGQPKGTPQSIEIVRGPGNAPNAPGFPTLSGTYNPTTGAVNASGRGPVAGFPAIDIVFVGSLTPQGALTGTLTVGPGGGPPNGLPNGPIVYGVLGNKRP